MKPQKLFSACLIASLLGCLPFGCSSADPENVIWTCSCSWTRDGMNESSESQTGCGSKDDAQGVVDANTLQCQLELDAVCTGSCAPCTCQCKPGDEECTPT
jgi:hypothetical protein